MKKVFYKHQNTEEEQAAANREKVNTELETWSPSFSILNTADVSQVINNWLQRTVWYHGYF